MSNSNRRRIHVVLVTSAHRRDDIRIFHKECQTLANSGIADVTLLVGDGLGSSQCNCVQVHDIGPSRRSRFWRMFIKPWHLYRAIRGLDAHAVHIHDPELLPMALALTWVNRKLVIYDAHEDVPRQILAKHWIPPLLRNLCSRGFEVLENFIVAQIYGVVAATPHIANRFSAIARRCVNVNNYPLTDELSPAEESKWLPGNQVCYVGAISRKRGVCELVQALPLVPHFRLALCGNFSEPDLEQEIRAMPGWAQVDYFGYVNRSTVRRIMSESLAGVVTLLPTPNHVDALPIKMFEYMACGIPVIASNFPLWIQILEHSAAGICVDPHVPSAIANAIDCLAKDRERAAAIGNAGRAAVLLHYNWQREASKLLRFYGQMYCA